jgi:alpha 1,3-glucosidase
MRNVYRQRTCVFFLEGDQNEVEGGSEAEETEADMWEESFGGHTDTKPNGPEAVAMDFAFTG